MPGAPLPLHIFEPRYRQLTVDLVTGAVPDKQFGVIAVREGWNAGEDAATLHSVGCTAENSSLEKTPDLSWSWADTCDRSWDEPTFRTKCHPRLATRRSGEIFGNDGIRPDYSLSGLRRRQFT